MKTIKYFFEFIIIISFFSIFKIVGFKNASNLGSVLGRIFGPLYRSKNITKKNLKYAFGDLDEKKESEIINGMWSNIGRNFAEYMFLKNFKINENSFDNIKINGKNYLDDIKKNNETVIFFSAHLANFELMALVLYNLNMKFATVYRPLNNFFLNPLMEYLRLKYICPIQIPKGIKGMREIIGKFKDGYSIALLVDQRLSEGPRISFFNEPAHTTTIPAQLALKYNCKLVPLSIERKETVNFEMIVHEPFKIKKTENNDQDIKNVTLKINKILEEMIIKSPKQWIWSHNRWK
jgi:Kdo2-lipid IVA lauroyltransferase/acyltransferase